VNVLTIQQFCARAKFSRRHFERLVAIGEGPPIVRLGAPDWRR
jgi:hypothetical protein